MKEVGRYSGVPLASGSANLQFDQGTLSYFMAISFNSPTLAAYLTSLDLLSTGFTTGNYACPAASASEGTTVTTTTTGTAQTGETTVQSTAPTPTTPTPPAPVEFMAEFCWSQGGSVMRSQTFTIFIDRQLLNAVGNGDAAVLSPPPPPTDWRFLATLECEGTPAPGLTFGFFQATQQTEVLGLQVALQQIDPNDPITITLVDTSGNVLAANQYFGILPADTGFAYLPFGQVLTLAPGATVRAQITTYAGNTAAGLVVNLLCRQYVTNSPAGPSGGPGVTAATVSLLPVGAQPTVNLDGQTLEFGLPAPAPGEAGQSVTGVTVNLGPVGSQATGAMDGGQLILNLPASPPGASAPASAASTVKTFTAGATQYSPGNPTVLTGSYTGRGKPALVSFAFSNSDNLGGAQNIVFVNVYRSDAGKVPIIATSFYMIAGHLQPFAVTVPIAATSTQPVTYSVQILAYNNTSNAAGQAPPGNPGFLPVSGTANNPTLTILELGS